MHEHKFTEQIVQAVLDELKTHSEVQPHCVKVTVGDIYHLEQDSVRMYFELLTQNTRLAGTPLDLHEEALVVRCKDCGKVGGVEDHHLPTCKECGSLSVEVIKGNKVEIQLVEGL